MAQAQAFHPAYAQANKGTLMPGQTITVNKYTVQVERYLSQGGFAHVYLVRTSTPVYNTTHHVLKRIAVPNETMLAEVKKEVDIMRILKGHPNIVCLIDAAWHRMANGTYEVFILMEYCPGGGIIDMMNRRLRERLTEQEILGIFVEVCEGLAAMHALKPPLLHRDLKVENILQASETSFKLCDFGSATSVQKVPSNTQEIRMLEADLNRHTTLQYRAPEMVDVYLRRPIDEKSDVWALGVLLYKLCYYTTPFEEHGPLAILNVQYRIPPYPVYSQQMNALIASMLREHGTQRPSVFEILNHVHTLRGTRSRFTYTIPPKQPPLSPRTATSAPLQTLSPNIMSLSSSTNPLDDLVTYKPRQGPAKNAGVEAREKVLEALAPMRRGRPASAVLSTPPASPRKEKSPMRLGTDAKFSADDDRAWRGVRGHKSGMATFGGGASLGSSNNADAWGLSGREKAGTSNDVPKGFDNDFSSFGKGFGDSFQPSRSPLPSPKPPHSQPPSQQSIPIPRPSPSPSKPAPSPRLQPKDAFDGLGLISAPPPPTLAEARRVRTGMANLGGSSSTDTSRSGAQYLSMPSTGQGLGIGTSNTTYRPPSSHSPMPTTSSKPQRSASPQVDPWKPHGKQPSTSTRQPGELSAEERFPSLEDLDREFTSPSPASFTKDKVTHPTSQPSSAERFTEKSHHTRPPSRTSGLRLGNPPGTNGTGAGTAASSGNRYDGVRSQQVTGAAMRESRIAASRQPSQNWAPGDYLSGGKDVPSSPTRPALTRRHRSSVTMKQPQRVTPPDETLFSPTSQLSPPALPPRPSASPRQEPRDWLTGASDDESQSQPVLRDSPSKRASFIEKSPVLIQKPLEAVTGEQDWPTTLELEKEFQQQERKGREREQEREKELVRKTEREQHRARASSPSKTSKAFVTRTGTGTSNADRGLSLPRVDTKIVTQRTGGASPSGLTSNWSPIESNSRPSSPLKPIKRNSASSSSDEGPEDVNGFLPKGEQQREKTKEHDGVKKGSDKPTPAKGELQRRRRTKSKSRQNSVHDLVDLWGGGLEKDNDPKAPRARSPDKRASVILPASKSSSLTKPIRTSSPQPLISTSTSNNPPLGSTTSRFIPPRPPSSHQHRKELSSKPAPGARALPAPIPSHTSSGRSRPQSMIVSPTNRKTTMDNKNNTPFPASVSSPSPQQSLSPPAQDARAKRSARRSSISDMVQRYEAIGTRQGPGPPAAAPTPAVKPAGLSVKSSSTGAGSTTVASTNASASSPSSAALRFPKLSPTNSPVLSKANLVIPEDAGQGLNSLQKDVSAKGRTSPAPSLTGLPSRGSAKASDTNTTIVNGLPRRASPMFTRKPSPRLPSPEPVAASMPSPRKAGFSGEEVVRSPSPEKPYQGVSSLIDRWQRAVDGSEGTGRGGAPRRIGGSLSGRGR